MSPLERQAVREILAEVRHEMDAMFGHSQASTSMDEARLAEMVHDAAARWLRSRANANLALVPDPARVEDEAMNWLVRMGPLEPLIRNPAYEEIFVDGPHEVGVVERTGQTVMLPDVYFDSDEDVREIAKRALASVNRRVDESSPMADARLKDGSRLNVVIPPISDRHTVLTIRTFRPDVDTLDRLVELGTITQELLLFLRAAVHAFLNILISGPTGSGKTTLLNALGNETDGLRPNGGGRGNARIEVAGPGSAVCQSGGSGEERRRHGRNPPARAGAQRAPDAAPPDHRRRNARSGNLGPAARHEHRALAAASPACTRTAPVMRSMR